MPANFLFIISETPYLTTTASETLDAAMALASYGQKVSIWFCSEGITNLYQDNDAKLLNNHDHGATLEGLDYFDIDEVLVTDLDYKDFQLEQKKLRFEPKVVPSTQMMKQLQNYKQIYRLS